MTSTSSINNSLGGNIERLRRMIAAAWVVGLVGSGSAVMVYLIATKPAPPARSPAPRIPSVSVVAVTPRTEQAPVIGYGTVRPKTQIQVVPQVSGKLVYAHQDLLPGKIIPAGELLFEIDSTIYEARLRQAEAEIEGLKAAIARHDQHMRNLDERIENVNRMLEIDEDEYLTSKRLFEVEKVGTQREVDSAYQKYLRQKDVVIQLENERVMVPHLKLETEAQLDAAQARRKQALHDLEGTRIFSPFRARIETVAARASQVVTAHFSIATLTDMGAFEVSVGIDPRDLRWLASAARPEALEKQEGGSSPLVKVSWSLPGQQFSWTGHVSRFERVDEVTRTARMVIEVRDVDMVASGGELGDSRPALSIGMHCRAELPAEPLEDAILVPRQSIYEDRWVYVFEPDASVSDGRLGRLGRRRVTMLRTLSDEVLVDYGNREGSSEDCELAQGDLVIVSPLLTPVVGMRLSLRSPAVPMQGEGEGELTTAWVGEAADPAPGLSSFPPSGQLASTWVGLVQVKN